jgi:hypothetical protein
LLLVVAAKFCLTHKIANTGKFFISQTLVSSSSLLNKLIVANHPHHLSPSSLLVQNLPTMNTTNDLKLMVKSTTGNSSKRQKVEVPKAILVGQRT